jgi:hypothetical protein
MKFVNSESGSVRSQSIFVALAWSVALAVAAHQAFQSGTFGGVAGNSVASDARFVTGTLGD